MSSEELGQKCRRRGAGVECDRKLSLVLEPRRSAGSFLRGNQAVSVFGLSVRPCMSTLDLSGASLVGFLPVDESVREFSFVFLYNSFSLSLKHLAVLSLSMDINVFLFWVSVLRGISAMRLSEEITSLLWFRPQTNTCVSDTEIE